ncbi:MAG: SigE family RNA polymerase sigma factor [Actinomycetota bacterium]
MALISQEAAPLGRKSVDRNENIGALFEAHYQGLCRLAYLILGDLPSAEEAVMDAFLRTFSAWARIRNSERSDAYLRRVVVNLCRTRSRRAAGEHTVIDQPALQSLNVEGALDVWQAVRMLPDRQRLTVILRYYEDLPDAEIANLMGCSVGTVKSQLAKARSTLAHLLKEENDDA